MTRALRSALALACLLAAACGGSTAPAEPEDVYVTPPAELPAKVTVSPNPATVAVGGTVNMVADRTGAAAGQAVTWSTSNAAIATVDAASGVVRGVAAGSVAITAKTTGNFSGSAAVTVGVGR